MFLCCREPWKYRLIIWEINSSHDVSQCLSVLLLCSYLHEENVHFRGFSPIFWWLLLYKHWVALWAMTSQRGKPPLQNPCSHFPCPVQFTSDVVRAKISGTVQGKSLKCEVVNYETPRSAFLGWFMNLSVAVVASRILLNCICWSFLTCYRELLESCLWHMEEK